MSTRCITAILDERGNEFCTIYRHCDGYPKGQGLELSQILIRHSQDVYGMDCLAASIVADMKPSGEGLGNVYIYPAGTRPTDIEYLYTVYTKRDNSIKQPRAGHVQMRVETVYTGGSPPNEIIYEGCPDNFERTLLAEDDK